MQTSTDDKKLTVHIVGGGLAGSECAFQLAERGHKVVLIEMRTPEKPETLTPAHKTANFAELVCSNSLGSTTDYSAPGQLKWEAEKLGSLILKAAKEAHVPAGMALGVDRKIFSSQITKVIESHPNITIERRVVTDINEVPRPTVIATGPLTDTRLAKSIQAHFNNEFLYFFDAIAPIIDTDSIDMNKAFIADRYGKGDGDYLNCPMTKEQYYNFITEVKNARFIESKDFENPTKETPFFEGCMPIEEMIRRGDETIRFGPLSPKGLSHPETGDKYYAVVQLRKENKQATAYNMVGFQTKMAYGEQKRIFSMIPGLEEAEFLKLGSIHRNMYIHSPTVLNQNLSSKNDEELYFAGQITGVEGYFESTCVGLMVAKFISDKHTTGKVNYPPRASAFGSILNALNEEKEHFQPTNINFGLLPALENPPKKKNKREKRDKMLEVAKLAFETWL